MWKSISRRGFFPVSSWSVVRSGGRGGTPRSGPFPVVRNGGRRPLLRTVALGRGEVPRMLGEQAVRTSRYIRDEYLKTPPCRKKGKGKEKERERERKGGRVPLRKELPVWEGDLPPIPVASGFPASRSSGRLPAARCERKPREMEKARRLSRVPGFAAHHGSAPAPWSHEVPHGVNGSGSPSIPRRFPASGHYNELRDGKKRKR